MKSAGIREHFQLEALEFSTALQSCYVCPQFYNSWWVEGVCQVFYHLYHLYHMYMLMLDQVAGLPLALPGTPDLDHFPTNAIQAVLFL